MPKYTFQATQHYAIEIEAENEEEAFDIALEIEFENWKQLGAEIEAGIE